MRCMAVEPVEPAAAREPHQKRLGLVVLGVRRHDGDRARAAVALRQLRQQPVARLARRILHAGRRLAARPGEDLVREPQRARLLADPLRLARETSARRP